MKIIGVTGGIGMGKSATAEILLQMDIPVIDSDDLAKEAVLPGSSGWKSLVNRYGNTVVLKDQSLNRKKISEIVFQSKTEKQWIESVLHPEIRQLRDRKMSQIISSNAQVHKFAVAWIVPLLFETNMVSEVNHVWCVACSSSTQLSRLRQRNWNETEIRNRMDNQWKIEQKMSLADVVIWNDFTLDILRNQVSLAINEFEQ